MELRFWIIGPGGSPVRMKLRPGQSLSRSEGGPTDEGYSAQGDTFEHCGDHVRREWWNDGRDCDGMFSQGGESCCRADQLDSHICDWEGKTETWPLWQPADQWQRDYQAEAAGY